MCPYNSLTALRATFNGLQNAAAIAKNASDAGSGLYSRLSQDGADRRRVSVQGHRLA
jgi:hypothetical protein